jgi:hypothetical protein
VSHRISLFAPRLGSRCARYFLFLSSLVLCNALLAQVSIAGKIAGVVTDPSGAAVPNASVKVESAAP